MGDISTGLAGAGVSGIQLALLSRWNWGIFYSDLFINQLRQLRDEESVLCTYKQVKLSLRH